MLTFKKQGQGKRVHNLEFLFKLRKSRRYFGQRRNEGRGGRFGLTQGGRKPVVTESHASKKAREGKLFSQQGGKTGKV